MGYSTGSARSVQRYFSHFFRLSAIRPQLADEFTDSTITIDIQQIATNKQNRQQAVDDFKLLVPNSSSACGSGTG